MSPPSPLRVAAFALVLVLVVPGGSAVLRPEMPRAPPFCDVPGPDAGGYSCFQTTFQWVDTQNGPRLALADDQVSAALPLPFAFPWYGGVRDRVHVGSDGLLCFDPLACAGTTKSPERGRAAPPLMPSEQGPNDLMACGWEDLDPTFGGGEVRTQVTGQAPKRTFTVEFHNVYHWSHTASNRFQLQLREDGIAQCMLLRLADDRDANHTAVGIEGPGGLTGLRYLQGNLSVANTGVRFCTPSVAPEAPGFVYGVPLYAGPGSATVYWAIPFGDCPAVTHYKVFRGPTPDNMALVAVVGDVNEHTDKPLPPGVHYYRISAVNVAGEGPRSEAAAVAVA